MKNKDLDRAGSIVKKHLGEMATGAIVEPLKGGASVRSYFRIILPKVPVITTSVLMMTGKRFRLENSDFYQVAEVFRKINLPVPLIYEDFSSDGALLLQDLGDMHLCDLVREIIEDRNAVEELYQQAIDSLVILQNRAENYSLGVKAFERAFDEKKLLWELDFAMKHFADDNAGFKPKGIMAKTLEAFFKDLVGRIANLPRVFCHRDYHSRNLLLWGEKLYIIDFQDARMGPHVYDLVSLLGDSYLDLGESLRRKLMEYFIEKHPVFKTRDIAKVTDQYNLMALQRHLKHLGTFGYQNSIGNSDMLEYVPLTIKYLRTNLLQFQEYKEAAEILDELFEISLGLLKCEK